MAIASVLVIICLIILIRLVYTVVCQVHEFVADCLHRVRVLPGRESSQAVVEQVNPERIVGGNVYVYSQVVFEFVNKMRIG